MTEVVAADGLDLSRWVRPGDTVLWAQACAEPVTLTRALVDQRAALGGVRCVLGIGVAGTARPEHADHLDLLAYCGSGTNRALVDAGVLRILPVHYSDLGRLLSTGPLRADVVLLALPPAQGGRHGWGLAHEYLAEPVAAARTVIAEVGAHVPVTGGPTLVAERVDVAVPVERDPVELATPPPDPVTAAVADRVATLIDDDAALQVGVGSLPQQVLARLGDRRGLRIRSGAVVDQVVDLAEAGALATGRGEPAVQGGILMGTRRIMRFADGNPEVALLPTTVTHARATMAALDRFVAVNSAIEVDLLGQVGSEVAAGRYVGAIGGSLDFTRGAHASPGGLPVVALPSTARRASRIVASLSGPCTIGRADAGVVVTEHGVADLRGRTEEERAELLVEVAHPDHRPALAEAAEALLRTRRPPPGGPPS